MAAHSETAIDLLDNEDARALMSLEREELVVIAIYLASRLHDRGSDEALETGWAVEHVVAEWNALVKAEIL